MSQPSFDPTPGYEDPGADLAASQPKAKQSLNIYTMMLVIAFVAMLAGTLLLLNELGRWGNFPSEQPWNTNSVRINTSQVELPRSALDVEFRKMA